MAISWVLAVVTSTIMAAAYTRLKAYTIAVLAV